MKPTPDWVQESDAVKQLGIGKSTLKLMRREGRLLPGEQWAYATGNLRGPVTYCIPKIRDMQRQVTLQLVRENEASRNAESKRRLEAIETYDEAALEQVIAEVQA